MHNVRPAGHLRPATSRQLAPEVQQEIDYFRYGTDIKTDTCLISQNLNDLNLNVEGENQLGYHLASHFSAFRLSILTTRSSVRPVVHNETAESIHTDLDMVSIIRAIHDAAEFEAPPPSSPLF